MTRRAKAAVVGATAVGAAMVGAAVLLVARPVNTQAYTINLREQKPYRESEKLVTQSQKDQVPKVV